MSTKLSIRTARGSAAFPVALVVGMTAQLAAAQVEPVPAAQPRGEGLAIELQGGYFDMTNAASSASAVFGSSGGLTLGGGLRYGLGRHLYAAVSGRRFTKTGERVFVADASSRVFRLGHPLDMRLTTIQATAGWRFRPGRSFVPYAGAGFGFASFDEESTVAGLRESNSQSKLSGHVLGGAEYGRRRVRFAAEVQYLAVPNTIGVGGVSKVYDETDVGGFSIVGKVAVGLFGR